MSKQALVVKAELTAEMIDIAEQELSKLQGAVDGLIQPVDLSPTITMWVNEEGLLRDDLKIHPLATLFMEELGSQTPIFGDVVFTGGSDEDGNTLGLTAEIVNELSEMTRRAKEYLEQARA